LVQRLQHARIHRGDNIHGRIQFFLAHARFPCVRKAALNSRIAQSHHRHGQAHEYLFAFAKTGDGMGVAVKRPEIHFIH
jgi:hypothetical protein